MRTCYPKSQKTDEKICFKTVDEAVFDKNGVPLSDRLKHMNNQIADMSKLTLAILGDGITLGTIFGDASFASLLGSNFESYVNYGTSGATLTQHATAASSLVERFNGMADNFDVILVMCTSNDWYHSVSMGETIVDEASHMLNTDIETYKGALKNYNS